MSAKKKQLVLDEDDYEVEDKMAKRLQMLKARNKAAAAAAPVQNTAAKIATKLLEEEEKEEEEEEQKEEEVEEEGEGEEEEGEEEGEAEEGEADEGEADEGEEGEDEEGEEGEREEEGEKQTKGTTEGKGKKKKASKQWAVYFDDDEKEEETEKKKTIKQDIENRGIVYLSTVPPNTNPDKLKHYFTSNFGNVTRIHLTQRSAKEMKEYKAKTGHRSTYYYKEGWIEFKDKSIAKRVASGLTGTQLGGRGFESKAVWNIKYLSKFKWTYLIEKLHQQKAEAHKVMTQKVQEAKSEIESYREASEKAQRIRRSKKNKKAIKATSTPIPQKMPHKTLPQNERKRTPILDQLVVSKRLKTDQ